MSAETMVTVVGNLTADPELRYTRDGLPVANLTVATTPRSFDRQSGEWVDGETAFLRGTVWRAYAEHVAASLHKGFNVIVFGALGQRSYETKDGEKRTTFELDIHEIGPLLRFATATVVRAARGAASADAWNEPAGESAALATA